MGWNPFSQGSGMDKIMDAGERMKFIYEMFSPLISGRTGENTPNAIKSILETKSHNQKDHDLMDEKVYMRILRQLSEEERKWVISYTTWEYSTDHSLPWMREAAKDGLDQWRKWIMFLVKEPVTGTKETVTARDSKGRPTETTKETYVVTPGDDSPAVEYLKLIAQDLKEAIEYIADKRKLVNTTISTMTKRQIEACKEEAFSRVTLNMQQLGQTWMPSPDDKPFATKAINFVQKMLKKKGASGQQLLTAALARSKSFIGFVSQKTKWLDEVMARQAATLRMNRESYLSWWGAYNHNRSLGMKVHSAIRHAPTVARDSRFGRWESWSYRISYTIMKRVLPF